MDASVLFWELFQIKLSTDRLIVFYRSLVFYHLLAKTHSCEWRGMYSFCHCRFYHGILQFSIYIYTLFWLSGGRNVARVRLLSSVHCCIASRLGLCTNISPGVDRTPDERSVWEDTVSVLPVRQWLLVFSRFFSSLLLYLLLFLHCALSCAVYYNRPCLFVCLFVCGSAFTSYSQRAVFASSLSSFSLFLCLCSH